MDITTYYLTENECFIEAKPMTPIGIVVHSTGANNPNLKRYIQPDDNRLGKGGSKHWNKKGVYKCAHAMIGKDKDGKVCTYLTLPTNICAWGVGQGSKGSYNYPPTACLQFEICEDGLTDKTYFDAVIKEAQELCASWCKEFSLPVSSIRSHKEAHAEGYASNHADIDHWLKKYDKTMDDFRTAVQKIIDDTNTVGTGVLDAPAPGGAANTPHPSPSATPSPQGEGVANTVGGDVLDAPNDGSTETHVGTGVLDGPNDGSTEYDTAAIKDALLAISEAILRLANTL